MKCKKCGVFLIRITKHNLCRKCARYGYNVAHKEKLLKERRCLFCCKAVEPIKCPHCKEIIRYPMRCKKCLKRTGDKANRVAQMRRDRDKNNTQEATNTLKGGFN